MPDGIYRVTWNHTIDPNTGEMTSSRFFKYAQSADDALLGINSLDVSAVLASDAEAEAYRSGFQDGLDVSKVGERQRTFDGNLLSAIDIQNRIEHPSIGADVVPQFECGSCHEVKTLDSVSITGEGLINTTPVDGFEYEWPLCIPCNLTK